MKMVVEKADVKAVKDCVREYLGLELTHAQAKEVFENAGYAAEFYEFGVYDTCTREYLADIFAKKIVGRNWPIGAEGDEVRKQFMENWIRLAPQKGYKLVQE